MQHLIIGFLIGGAIFTVEQAHQQTEALLEGTPIAVDVRWINADAYNRVGEFLSECESLTGCFSS